MKWFKRWVLSVFATFFVGEFCWPVNDSQEITKKIVKLYPGDAYLIREVSRTLGIYVGFFIVLIGFIAIVYMLFAGSEFPFALLAATILLPYPVGVFTTWRGKAIIKEQMKAVIHLIQAGYKVTPTKEKLVEMISTYPPLLP